jgi:hypothetical protein
MMELSMFSQKGFLQFNTAKDYLAYQERLIKNWERYYQYHDMAGGTMSSEVYRQTGRTYASLTAAVELAEEGSKVLYITYKSGQINQLTSHPAIKKYSTLVEVPVNSSYNYIVENIHFISYEKCCLRKPMTYGFDYYIYDHTVFEFLEPKVVYKNTLLASKLEEAYRKEFGYYPEGTEPNFILFNKGYNAALHHT